MLMFHWAIAQKLQLLLDAAHYTVTHRYMVDASMLRLLLHETLQADQFLHAY